MPLVKFPSLFSALPRALRHCSCGARLITSSRANPIEYITHHTGDWTLRFVAASRSQSRPLRNLLKLPELIRFRRMLGLFAFFYGCLHFVPGLAR